MRLRRTYNLTKREEKLFVDFLAGKLTTRELGKKLGMSHQGVISATCSLCREWYQDGKLKVIKKK